VTTKHLRMAGFLAMTSAILGIPALLISYYLATTELQADALLLAAVQLLGLFLFTALTLSFKKLLNSRFLYHRADNYFDFLVATYLFYTAASISSLFLPSLQKPLDLFSMLLVCAIGVAQVLLGINLFQLPDSLYGMRKPYCLLNIITGVLVASIVLLPIGVIIGAIADVMLGTIFFQAAAQPDQVPGAQQPPATP
jgi:hypothetical protein